MVRERRLELLYREVPDPKSGASANSATLASVLNHETIDHGRYLTGIKRFIKIGDNRGEVKKLLSYVWYTPLICYPPASLILKPRACNSADSVSR